MAKGGPPGKAPISRVLLRSHRKIPEDGATTKCSHTFPSPRHSSAVPSSLAFPRALPGTEQPGLTQTEEEEGKGAEDREAWGEKDTAQAAPCRYPQGSPRELAQGHPSIPPGPFCPSSSGGEARCLGDGQKHLGGPGDVFPACRRCSRAAGLPWVRRRSRRHLPRPPTLPHPRAQISGVKARTVPSKKKKIINPSHQQRSCQNSRGRELNYVCTSELNSGIS